MIISSSIGASPTWESVVKHERVIVKVWLSDSQIVGENLVFNFSFNYTSNWVSLCGSICKYHLKCWCPMAFYTCLSCNLPFDSLLLIPRESDKLDRRGHWSCEFRLQFKSLNSKTWIFENAVQRAYKKGFWFLNIAIKIAANKANEIDERSPTDFTVRTSSKTVD